MTESLLSYVVADNEKCVGCKACELACFAEHNHKENKVGKTVGTVTVPVTPKLFLVKGEGVCMPIQCRHCEDAPCKTACTVKVIKRMNGHIIVNTKTCTGCKDCIMACPFGAIDMQPISCGGTFVILEDSNEIKKAAAKCDMCIESSDGPACVRCCPNKALRIVNSQSENDDKRIRAAQILAVTQN